MTFLIYIAMCYVLAICVNGADFRMGNLYYGSACAYCGREILGSTDAPSEI